jgi:ABC-2 type transport system ATP-binding protein
MNELIVTKNLSKEFGSFVAVDGVTLRVEAGEVLALLGPNGAGKTTTIRMMASILNPTRGWAKIAGYDVSKEPENARRSLGLLTEHHSLYTRMQALDYLAFFGQTYGLSAEESRQRAQRLVEQFGMSQKIGLRLGEYSKGMRQKLALARALLHDPPVLLLDEPTSAMDPASALKVRESIANLRSSKRAVIVCTHNLIEAEVLADRIAIICCGRIVARGTITELKKAFLGDCIMELRLAQSVDGFLSHLPTDLCLLERGVDWVRYKVSNPESENPKVLKAMAEANVPVVTLAEIPRSLEEVYLKVVEHNGEKRRIVA